MTPQAHLVGGYSTAFGKLADRTYKSLVREAVKGALSDAGLIDGLEVDKIWFGSAAMGAVGQGSVRGQVCLAPLQKEGLLPAHAPVVNVENACATGTSAVYGAWLEILAGQAHLALVVCVDKLTPPPGRPADFSGLAQGIDQQDPEEWMALYEDAGRRLGKPFEPSADRSIFMDMDALQALAFMKRSGVTERHFAVAAAKTHNYGALNPRAQYRFEMTPESVLADRMVSPPLTRAMCAPIGDGAAALLLCSAEALRYMAPSVRERAVAVRTCTLAGGRPRALQDENLSAVVARRAYAAAGVEPQDIDLAEVHDASSFLEVYQVAALGFAPEDRAGAFVEAGETGPGGRVPMNTSGGLVSKGHPIGPTGASMIYEVMEQLRGEAGPRQVRGARLGLTENSGGIVTFDHAVGAVTILERG